MNGEPLSIAEANRFLDLAPEIITALRDAASTLEHTPMTQGSKIARDCARLVKEVERRNGNA